MKKNLRKVLASTFDVMTEKELDTLLGRYASSVMKRKVRDWISSNLYNYIKKNFHEVYTGDELPSNIKDPKIKKIFKEKGKVGLLNGKAIKGFLESNETKFMLEYLRSPFAPEKLEPE